MLDYILDYILDHILDHIIIGLVTTALHFVLQDSPNGIDVGLA